MTEIQQVGFERANLRIKQGSILNVVQYFPQEDQRNSQPAGKLAGGQPIEKAQFPGRAVQAPNNWVWKVLWNCSKSKVWFGGEYANFVPTLGQAIHDIANPDFVASVGIGRVISGKGQDAHLLL